MIQQCQNKNLTTDDTNKLQKNVGMTQQCQNKNLTKDDTNKVQKNVGMTQQCWNKNLPGLPDLIINSYLLLINNY